MTVIKTPNFSPEQERAIRDAAAAGPDGRANLAIATELAEAFGKKARSVIAKMNRMGVPYARKVPTTKTGDPVVKKSDLVAEIADLSGNAVSDLDGLEKASKAALQLIAGALR